MKSKGIDRGVTLKSVIITMILIPLNYYWIIVGEYAMGRVSYMLPSFIVPFYNVIFCLSVIIGINFLFRKLFKTPIFTQGELLTIYVLLSSACALCSIIMMNFLVETMGHASWFATPENEWEELFLRYLPNWLTVQSKSVLRGYYEGESSLYTSEHLKAWVGPAVIWCAFTVVLVFVMLCINVIVRKQWTEKERLSYPITQLPFGMADTKDNFFASKLTWIGFAIASAITIVNGLNFLYPSIPSINIHRRSIAYLFTEKPLNAVQINGFNISFYPFALGLSFLLPLDLAFSCWFFYLLGKVELVIGSIAGWTSAPGFPYNVERTFGASVSLIIFMIWVGRSHFRYVLLRFFGRIGSDDSAEAMSYRTAVLGIIFGLGFLSFFAVMTGMSLWVTVAFFAIFLALSIMVTRMRAELGFFTHRMDGMMAPELMIKLTGTRILGTKNLVAMALLQWFNAGFTSHPMPHQLEGLKLAEKADINKKKLAFGIMFITAFGALAFFWVFLHIFYRLGAPQGGGRHPFTALQYWISQPREADSPSIIFMGGGFLFSAFLSIMRLKFIWWVFHPVGYIVANLQWEMRNFWVCMLISSTIKWMILKYNGPKGYRKAVKFSVGLVLGDFVTGGLWNVIGLIFNTPTYSFWPGPYLT